jgi:hypothetical protein
LPLLLLYVVNFSFQTIGQFFAPAEAAMIPAIVSRGRLLQANGLFHLTFTASQLGGLVILGPLMVKRFGLQGLLATTAVAIMACGLLVWPLPRTRGQRQEAVAGSGGEAVASVWADVRAVGSFVLGDARVTLVMIQWTIGAILGLVVATLVPSFSEKLLRVHAEDAVFVMAPAGIGMVAGTFLINRYGDRFARHLLTVLGLSVVALMLLSLGGAALVVEALTGGSPPLIDMPGMGLVSSLTPLVMFLALIAGVGFVAIMVPTQTYLQEHAPVELRGRVFGVLFMLNNLATIPPLLLLGGLADLIGVEKTLILIGGAIAVAAIYSAFQKDEKPSPAT